MSQQVTGALETGRAVGTPVGLAHLNSEKCEAKKYTVILNDKYSIALKNKNKNKSN